ncbi:MAG: LysR family transcriptional regulator [Hyphomicrobiales bacterium]|nr:LysR family transcriptional regulator [Hyphomicrobiales bacterium]
MGVAMNVLESMRVFQRVAELESFTKVANETGTSQSSVSKHVSALERRLGAKLMNRSTRRLRLTDAGSEYYQRCLAILGDIEEAESAVANRHSEISGPIRISAPDTFGRFRVMPLLWDFLARYPKVELDISLDDKRADIVKEGVDLAIRSAISFDPTWITRKLCDVKRVLVASPKYLNQFGSPVSIEDLKRHDCIIYSLASTGQIWDFQDTKIRVRGRVRVSSPEAATMAAQNGFGITLSPEWLVRGQVDAGLLVPVLTDCVPVPFEVHAVLPERRFISARVRYILEHLDRNLS